MTLNPEEQTDPEPHTASVTVTIPCRAEYVAVARLAMLGIANRLAYSYDEVEDLRLAVGEACTHAVERAHAAMVPRADSAAAITIVSNIGPDGLDVEVRDNIPPGAAVPESDSDDDLGFDKQDLGALLLEILVDRFTVRSSQNGTTVHLFKSAPIASAGAAST